MVSMKKIIVFCVLAALLGWPFRLSAQIYGAGTSVYNFLSLPYSARLNALGGDNVAIQDAELSTAMMNPALLNKATDKVLQLNYAYWMQGTMFGSVIYGHNFGRGPMNLVGSPVILLPPKTYSSTSCTPANSDPCSPSA